MYIRLSNYIELPGCGSIETAHADLVSGLCPVCRREGQPTLPTPGDYQEALAA